MNDEKLAEPLSRVRVMPRRADVKKPKLLPLGFDAFGSPNSFMWLLGRTIRRVSETT
jgi:hypothetical protein